MKFALYLQLGEGETFERAAGRHKKHWTQNQAMTWDLGWLWPSLNVNLGFLVPIFAVDKRCFPQPAS